MKQYENKMDKVLEQVRNHIARAEDPRTPPAEAAVARERADILMYRYKIDTLTAAPQDAPGIEPVWAEVPIARGDSEWAHFYVGFVRDIARHCDLRFHYEYKWHLESDGVERYWYVAYLVGFESDVAYAQLLIANAQVAFGRNLEPKYDPKETDAANALRLRQGGMERRRIAVALFGPSITVNEQKAKNRKVTNLIKEEATRLGDPGIAEDLLGRGNSIKTYRDSYASGFYSTLVQRLRDVAIARGQFTDGTIVLAAMKERVDEAFYQRFPRLRPQPVGTPVIGEVQEECGKCKRTKSGYCRDHAWKRPRAGRASTKAFNWSAAAKGSTAARTVDLGGPTPRVGS